MTVENILTIYKMATPEEKRDGIVWYANALSECNRISLDLDIPLHIVTGVCAALSPNNKWDRNIVNARDLCQAFINGDDIDSVKVSTYHKMKQKAWGILDAMPDYDTVKMLLSGKKITCFYENIMGEDTCTIDGHARNIAYAERVNLTDAKTSVGVKEYAELQEAYLEATKRLRYQNKRPKSYELQAVTWVAWRRMHGIK